MKVIFENSMKNPFQFKYPTVKVVCRETDLGNWLDAYIVNPEAEDSHVDYGTLLFSNILEFALLELTKGKE